MLEMQRGFGEETGLRSRDAVGNPRSAVPVGFALESFISKWLKPEAAQGEPRGWARIGTAASPRHCLTCAGCSLVAWPDPA